MKFKYKREINLLIEESSNIKTILEPFVFKTLCEIEKLLWLDYDKLFHYLWKKYGLVKYDYYDNLDKESSKWKKINDEHSSKHGLYRHHINEKKIPGLSNDNIARNNESKHQKIENLVYCTLLEHLVLHIKIIESNIITNNDYCDYIMGVVYIIGELNYVYWNYKSKDENKTKTYYKKTLELYTKSDYLKVIEYILNLDQLKNIDLFKSYNVNNDEWFNSNNSELYQEILELQKKYNKN